MNFICLRIFRMAGLGDTLGRERQADLQRESARLVRMT